MLAKFLFAVALLIAPSVAAQTVVVDPPPPPPPPPPLTATPIVTPNPDPTALTQTLVDRAVAAVRELFKVQLDAIIARQDRLQVVLDARPDEVQRTVDAAITNLQALVQQKFIGVDQQFAGRDVALAAALLAQKTAVDEQNKSNALSISKSDAATTKQIDTISLNVDTKTAAINEKVDDLRARIQAIESRAIGVGENRDNTSGTYTLIFGVIGAAGVIFGIMMVVLRQGHIAPPSVVVERVVAAEK